MRKALLPVAAAAVIGATGWALITKSEGIRFKPYRDVVGVWTVCYGHTGPDIIPGRTYTQAECDTLLVSDIKKHQPVFIPGNPRNCIRNAPITANQRDALTSFTINVGTGNFCRSTMAKRLSARDYYGAAREFPKWNKAAGKVYPGLVTRRAEEQSLFLDNQRSEPRDTLSGRATAILMRLS
jgi:lysozyme